MQIRLNMNKLDLGKGSVPGGTGMWSPSDDNPVLDYRDEGTVWVWLRDNLCIELSFEEVEMMRDGFAEQFSGGE